MINKSMRRDLKIEEGGIKIFIVAISHFDWWTIVDTFFDKKEAEECLFRVRDCMIEDFNRQIEFSIFDEKIMKEEEGIEPCTCCSGVNHWSFKNIEAIWDDDYTKYKANSDCMEFPMLITTTVKNKKQEIKYWNPLESINEY